MTIAELKVGSRIMIGKYGVSDRVFPIWWLKATQNCDFITESVLDYLMFDAKEHQGTNYGCRNYGNPNYDTSNIRQFLNSEDDDWYRPQHDRDNAPGSRGDSMARYGDPVGTYKQHCGFLRHFEDYEIESLSAPVELPDWRDVDKYGQNKFEVFKKKGVRPHGTRDYVFRSPCCPFDEGSYMDFWVKGRQGEMVEICDRTGNLNHKAPATPSGLRPKCKIKGDIEVQPVADAEGFIIVPFEVGADSVVTDEELFTFLGLR